MKRILLPILVIGVLLLSSCIVIQAPGSDTKEEVTEEPAPEETATEEPALKPAAKEAPTEEPTPEEPITQPEPEPAKFELTNLKITPAPDVSETTYKVSVDIQNTGGTRGKYQIKSKVNDQEMDVIEVELDPGAKKTVTLIEAQKRISLLATQYNEGQVYQQTHTVSTGSLSQTVTFPKLDYKLQLLSSAGTLYGDEKVVINGQVKNISNESLKDVEAVIVSYDSEGAIIATMSNLIWRNPIEPGQTSAFDVQSNAYFAKRYRIYFRFKDGDRILTDYSVWNK